MKDLDPADDLERQSSAVRHHHRLVVLSGQPRRQRGNIDRAPAVGLLPIWPAALRFRLGRYRLISRRAAVARGVGFLLAFGTPRLRGSAKSPILAPRGAIFP